QKVRTALTTLGVVVGTVALTLSIALSRGVNDHVLREFTRHDQFRQIAVWPTYRTEEADIPADELKIEGNLSAAKRERVRAALLRRWSRTHPLGIRKPLTRDQVKVLSELEHVETIFPAFREPCRVIFEDRREDRATFVPTAATKYLRRRLIAGEFFSS